MKKPELLIVLIALLATAAKVYCALTTVGSVDVAFFRSFGEVISDRGVTQIYRENPLFNHPPLLGTYLGFAYDWAGKNARSFSWYLRLPGILADLASVLILLVLRRKLGAPSWWALGLFAASPVSFMISGYHGNFDPLIPFGLLLVVAACVYRQPALCGLFLGMVCQVKIIPVLFAPVFFFYWWERRKAVHFVVAMVAVVLAGWLVPLLAVPDIFLKRVLAYNSIWGWWGFSYLIAHAGGPGLNIPNYSPPNGTVIILSQVLKLSIIAGVLTLAWRKRHGEAREIFSSIALCWGIFFVLAPGFGTQYLVWIGPFLAMHSARWFAIFTAAASVALFAFYTIISQGIPWDMGFHVQSTMNSWTPWLLLPWLALVAFLVASRKSLFAAIAPAPTAA